MENTNPLALPPGLNIIGTEYTLGWFACKNANKIQDMTTNETFRTKEALAYNYKGRGSGRLIFYHCYVNYQLWSARNQLINEQDK